MVYYWNDFAIETMRALWQEGKSSAQVARDLGGGLTRNAVLGKLHRLGIQGRPVQPRFTPVHRAPPAPKPRLQLPSPHRQPSALMASRVEAAEKRAAKLKCEAMTEAPNGGVTIMELTDRTCRWAFGDPREASFRFCGMAKSPDSGPWCPDHRAMAYEPRRERSAA